MGQKEYCNSDRQKQTLWTLVYGITLECFMHNSTICNLWCLKLKINKSTEISSLLLQNLLSSIIVCNLHTKRKEKWAVWENNKAKLYLDISHKISKTLSLVDRTPHRGKKKWQKVQYSNLRIFLDISP